MVIKADSPATFAEKYIIESIWNNHFPQGSILPAERELSELIGVTRTTLREVLQRLARDGWLTIQHGKPTRVNDYMNTSGLNILDTLVTLEGEDVQGVLENLLAARTDISGVYMRYAVKNNPQACADLIEKVIGRCESLLASDSFGSFIEMAEEKEAIQQDVKKIFDTFGKTDLEICEAVCRGRAFNHFDYMLFQGMAQCSGNKVYVLTMNGMRKIYSRVGGYYFMDKRARELAIQFYRDLLVIAKEGRHLDVADRIKQYGRECGAIWFSNRETIARLMEQEEA
ncbi:fatty acid metabolism transcriptional regulator FadR [Grimontia hollisae]|uniref:Fatty acid metabolism regulator protein n=2 Tax=Grimontia hollisae TaxID=673 RepID=D0I745_GRIHO|nr:fatty acid metabolism transcriptional regulator FadR [Grimontia hollisae]AMG31368.1 fatty acid metabolism transcriptional regulator FadR [Grimontia hollisae]EEY72464.1 fatty acid metabolism regulator [Grimontia hollisae CIP 101886]MDF2185727.1 fatty acid metabolism transcriptional regulator FadR [Grimontia hollisae]STO45793.1 Fatty acid metabolism regulator protein [Grimontia hollisae]STO58045.1 Fatty acid metabolism regulator protein [Grimontia hollisae]